MNKSVSVIGSGAWGKAIAKVFDASNVIPGRADATNIATDYCFICVEAAYLRGVLAKHKFATQTIIIITEKGIEQGSLKLMSDVLEELLPNKYAILSGPNFAAELDKGLPAATAIASKDITVGEEIITNLASPVLRMYFCDDVISTQIGGALKNIIAIAAGICVGKGLGENARAAVITRGLAEIARLTSALGGESQHLMGLAGIGDLMLTAMSEKSRNTAFGISLGRGEDLQKLLAEKSAAIEGYYSASSVHELAQKLNIEMPICKNVYEILYINKNITEAVKELVNRPQK